MKLSPNALSEFREIYFQITGKNLSDERMNEEAVVLLNYFKLIYRPIPKAYVLENSTLVVSSEHTS